MIEQGSSQPTDGSGPPANRTSSSLHADSSACSDNDASSNSCLDPGQRRFVSSIQQPSCLPILVHGAARPLASSQPPPSLHIRTDFSADPVDSAMAGESADSCVHHSLSTASIPRRTPSARAGVVSCVRFLIASVGGHGRHNALAVSHRWPDPVLEAGSARVPVTIGNPFCGFQPELESQRVLSAASVDQQVTLQAISGVERAGRGSCQTGEETQSRLFVFSDTAHQEPQSERLRPRSAGCLPPASSRCRLGNKPCASKYRLQVQHPAP